MKLTKADWKEGKKEAETLLKQHIIGKIVNETIIELCETMIEDEK